jgi:hypothetical protein
VVEVRRVAKDAEGAKEGITAGRKGRKGREGNNN